MVVVTTSTLVMPPQSADGHHLARRSVSLLPAALVVSGVPMWSRQTRSKQLQPLGACNGRGGSSSSRHPQSSCRRDGLPVGRSREQPADQQWQQRSLYLLLELLATACHKVVAFCLGLGSSSSSWRSVAPSCHSVTHGLLCWVAVLF